MWQLSFSAEALEIIENGRTNVYMAASHHAEPLILCPEGGIIMPKNPTITLTPDELKLLLEAMEDEEFIMSIPLLLEDLEKEEFDAEKEVL